MCLPAPTTNYSCRHSVDCRFPLVVCSSAWSTKHRMAKQRKTIVDQAKDEARTQINEAAELVKEGVSSQAYLYPLCVYPSSDVSIIDKMMLIYISHEARASSTYSRIPHFTKQ